MSKRSICVRLICAAALMLPASVARAQDGAQGALTSMRIAGLFEQRLVVADLDNDTKPDGAVLLDSGWPDTPGSFKIQLHFTGRPNTELEFESSTRALTLTARDVDHDGATDLVVEERFTHKPLHVWINEGHGDFHEGRLQDFPSLAEGPCDQLQPPMNQRDCGRVCLAVERGFETGLLTAPQFGRPPSNNGLLAIAAALPADSRVRAPSSSRAPPLS